MSTQDFELRKRIMMDGPRDHFLARAALAGDEHGGIGDRHLFDYKEELPHGIAAEHRGGAKELLRFGYASHA